MSDEKILSNDFIQFCEIRGYPSDDYDIQEMLLSTWNTALASVAQSDAKPVAWGEWDTQLGKGHRLMMVSPDPASGCRVPLYAATPSAQDIRNAALEEAAKAVESVKDRSGVNEDGRTWLQRANKSDFIAAIRTMRSAPIPQVSNAQQWISVKDRLPDVSGRFLVVVSDHKNTGWATCAFYDAENNDWGGDHAVDDGHPVTHWMHVEMPLKDKP